MPPGRNRRQWLRGAVLSPWLLGPALPWASERLPAAAGASAACSMVGSPPGAPAQPPADALDVRRFGASGTGQQDDTAALQRALDALQPGQWLVFPPGRYRHAASLHIRRERVTLWGQGATLHASNPADQALLIQASGVRVRGFRLTAATDRRRAAPWESRLAIWREGEETPPVTDIELRDNHILAAGEPGSPLANGSSSAAIFVHRVHGFAVIGNTIQRPLSDGIHITGGARHGVVLGNTVRESGDDMIAVVSYLGEGDVGALPPAQVAQSLARRRRDELVQDVLIAHNDVAGQYWGRGISVVGGEQVSIVHNRIDATHHAAAVYIAREQGWCTFGVRDVRVADNHISRVQTTRPAYSVLNPPERWQRTGHGAVELVAHVFDDEAAEPALREALQISGVLVQRNRIEDSATPGIRIGYGWGEPQRQTWRGASLKGAFRRYSGAPIRRVQLLDNRLARVGEGGVQVLNGSDVQAALAHGGNLLDGLALVTAAGRPVQPGEPPAAVGARQACR